MSARRSVCAALVGAATLASVLAAAPVFAAPDSAVVFAPGSAGIGDPYFPNLGNGGYDVGHYGLQLSYDPSRHFLVARATITSRATQNLSRFDLDLDGMTVHGVSVDGAGAHQRRDGGELVITPAHGITTGSSFTTVVSYTGTPKTITGSPIVFGADYGWMYTRDGVFVADEPNAAHTWFPCSDHPSDKATYTFDVTVPKTKQVVANGELSLHTTGASKTRYIWNETKPMASYLATIDIGSWTFQHRTTPGGIPQLMAYDPALSAAVAHRAVGAQTAAVTDYWAHAFGPYPFTSTGAIVDNLPTVGFSLETQTRPLYGFAPDKDTYSHELAHQWFGDSVSVATWRAIWLNEGFATFAQWFWSDEHTGHTSTYDVARGEYNGIPASNGFWNQSIADPQRDTMFSSAVYSRGGMTLAALRHRIGSTAFFSLLRQWTAAHRYGHATTTEFIALAEKVSGRNLDRFFQIWLYDKRKPSSFDAG